MEDAQKLIEAKIGSKKVMIFSKSSCGFCHQAKQVFMQYLGNVLSEDEYEVMEIDGRRDCENLQKCFAKMTGARTVPRVFIKGKCIGGGSETNSLHSSGKLQKMLA